MEWIKENAIILLIILCVTGVISFTIHNSFRLAIVKAEVQKFKAEEGLKLKFGITKDKER